MMGYRRVNFYELCRLCTSNEGLKTPIFKGEGRSRQLQTKIQICLRLQVSSKDALPKYICSACLDKLESYFDFRTSCVSADVMLLRYANALKNNPDFQTEGKVYIKENRLSSNQDLISEAAKTIELPLTEDESVVSDETEDKPIQIDSFATLVEAATIQIIPDICGEIVEGDVKISDEHSYSFQERSDAEIVAETIVGHEIRVESPQHEEIVSVGAAELELDQETIELVEAAKETDVDVDPLTEHNERIELEELKCTVNGQVDAEFENIYDDKQDRELLRWCESESNKIECPICNKTFKRKEHLYQHKRLHTGERPFKCAHCHKSFSRKEHLVRHSHSHTGQKLYECDLCCKTFSRKDNLRKHRKTHDASGPFSCETCGKQFAVKPYYLMHKSKHANQQ